MNSSIDQLNKNLERLMKEREKLIEQNGTYDSYEEQRGLDVYTVRMKNNNGDRISELNMEIARIKEAIEQETNRLGREASIARVRQEQEERAERYRNSKYTYEAGGKEYKTNNPALAARYDAQHRFFGLSKMKQSLYKLNGQYDRFDKLWNMVDSPNKEQVAEELDSLFGGKHGK